MYVYIHIYICVHIYIHKYIYTCICIYINWGIHATHVLNRGTYAMYAFYSELTFENHSLPAKLPDQFMI